MTYYQLSNISTRLYDHNLKLKFINAGEEPIHISKSCGKILISIERMYHRLYTVNGIQ